MRNLSLERHHLVNAYEVEAGIGVIAGNTVWSTPERLECEVLQKARYINTLTFTFFYLVCKQATGRSSRRHMLNDLAAWAFAAAGVPVVKKPAGLVCKDGKRPDGLTLIPFESDSVLSWYVMVVCSMADSCTDLAVQGAGSVAQLAASRKHAKYVDLQRQYNFQPIAVETLGPINESACAFLDDLVGGFRSWLARTVSTCFVSASFSRYSMLQCGSSVWHFCSSRSHGLLSIPDFLFPQF